MISVTVILLAACFATADKNINKEENNKTNIDKRLDKFLSFAENRTFDARDLEVLNRTAYSLKLDQELVSKLRDLVNSSVKTSSKSKSPSIPLSSSSNHGRLDEGRRSQPVLNSVEESPAYASSVVLASDLLSLTKAVANVKDRVCREQGYKFLDGLLLNHRWALRSKFLLLFVLLD